jgi:hypothetical protein
MPEELHIGFTGTRKGATGRQIAELQYYWHNLRLGYPEREIWLHHGAARGADAEAWTIAFRLGFKIWIHPSDVPGERSYAYADRCDEPEAPLARNKTIVQASTYIMYACPFEMNEQRRGGTWATIRYAKQAVERVGGPTRLVIIYPMLKTEVIGSGKVI